jgi:CubicO group peptidase (beta-lactamase class C family)
MPWFYIRPLLCRKKEAENMVKRASAFRKIAGLIVPVLFLLAGCETQKSLTRARIKSVENGLLRAVYIKGLKPERLRLEDRMQFYQVPGVSLAVIDNHAVEWARAYGVSDVQTHQLVTPDTLFQGGAFSQAVAAAVTLHLVEKGRLDLEGDIHQWLRSWKLPTPSHPAEKFMTLRQLLTHSAGLAAQVFDGYSQTETLPGLEQVLSGEKPAKNVLVWGESPPGSRARYSESNYVVLEQLLSDVENKPFSDIAQEFVFGPLGMKQSTFEVLPPSAAPERAAFGHLRDGKPVDGGWHNYPGAAAKGLWTTPSDFAAFVVELLQAGLEKSSKVLSPAAARSLLSPQVGNYTFGFSVDGRGDEINFSIRGKTDGFSCFAVLYPARGQGAVIMTNSENGAILIEEMLRALSAAYEWPHFKPEEKALYRLDPSIYQQYIGRYQVNPNYILRVSQDDFNLIIQPTGQAPTKFYVEGETLFFSIDPFIRIQFRKDKQGNVDSLVLWQQDFELTAKKIE